MMEKVDFAFVWKEEQDVLSRLAAGVPENGTIVEIGTAMGGTSFIYHKTTAGKNVKIYTVDILDCTRARKNLKDTDVILVRKASSDFARTWIDEIGVPIDFLYIDGDHNFTGIYEDFNAWYPLVAPQGTVAFHDYDPDERGGIAHFAVKVFLDTLLSKGLLKDARHEYKILYGFKGNTAENTVSVDECFKTFLSIGKGINSTVGKMFDVSIPKGLDTLRERGAEFDSVQACYCIDNALKADFEYVDTITHSFHEFRRWVEMLSVLEHSSGTSLYPRECDKLSTPQKQSDLSQIIAREQLRISILRGILKTIVRWEP